MPWYLRYSTVPITMFQTGFVDLRHLPIARRPALLHQAFVTFGSLELWTAHLPFRWKSTLYNLLNMKLLTLGLFFGLRTSLILRCSQSGAYCTIKVLRYPHVPGQSDCCVVSKLFRVSSVWIQYCIPHYPYCTVPRLPRSPCYDDKFGTFHYSIEDGSRKLL